jgi:hypothetical protein
MWGNQGRCCMRARIHAYFCVIFLFCCSSLGHGQNHQAAIGDLNGDGKPDIVVANSSLNNVGVFLNAGSGPLGPGAFLAVAGRPDSISLADLNADGHLDLLLVVVDSSGHRQLQAMLGDGKGGFAAPIAVSTGSAEPISNTVIADFNGDGIPDVAFGVNAVPPQAAIIFGDGHGGFSAPRLIAVANDTTFVDELLLLDANKDGKADLIVNTARVASIFIHESFLLLNDGKANFSVSHLSSSGFSGDAAGFVTAIADFNADGNPDLLFGRGSSAFIMFGDGQGGALSASPPLSFGVATPQGFAADVDGNQTIDLVSSNSYFPGNGHGGFGDPIPLSFPSGSTLIALADFNGDGKPDFVLQSGTSISVVVNTLSAPASVSASTQLQLSLSAATTSVGLPVTLTAAVASYGGVPSGSVTFFEGTQSLGSAPVDIYGNAAITSSFSTGGLHNTLTASFTGALNPATNTVFGNSSAPSPSSISVNTSQPTAPAPTVSLTAFPNPARLSNPVTVAVTVTSPSGSPTGNVVLRADGEVAASFPIGQARVIFPTVGLHNLQAAYGGDANFPQATSPALVEDVRLSVPADFTMDASPQSATIRAGQSATFNLTVNPIGDLASTVGFSCSGLPAGASCTFSPASLTPGINPVSTTLTLTTTAPATGNPFNLPQPGPLVYTYALAGLGLLLLLAAFPGRKTVRRAAFLWAATAFALLLGSCGGGSKGGGTGGGPNGTPAGTSSITVTAISATSHTTAFTVTVTP